ncbi:MAG: ECF transporter S component [Acholeplasmataceae bacterium]|nr:ECF transporter S component [Acholeplasmataceae bacterium]HOA63750.1 ECF transporter S component [Bacilli bacterium]
MISLNKKIALTAILSTLATILYMFIKFPLPMLFPSFLDFQVSNLPAIIGGFLLGPVYGSLIVIIRFLIKLPFSSTQYVGELADLIIGLAVVISSSIIYIKNKTRKGALIALTTSTVIWVITSVLLNRYVLVPFYIELFFKGDVNAFVNICKIIPGINEQNYMQKYLVYAVLPFNLLLSISVNLITFLVYKRLSNFIKTYFNDEQVIELSSKLE